MIEHPRILVEPNAHHLLNFGDVAMLQIAVERFRALWPEAQIHVLTDDPARLAVFCPDALPLDAAGRRLWLSEPYFTRTLHARLPRRGSLRLRRAEAVLRLRAPRTARRLARVGAAARGQSAQPLDEFLTALREADLVVSTGAGALTDHFASLAVSILELLADGDSRGAVTALLGHGIGPISDRALARRICAVLPLVDLITLREHVVGGPIVSGAGVDPGRVFTTGDDALELAHRVPPPPHGGDGLGFNLRRARYSGVDGSVAEELAAEAARAAERYSTEVVPVPISIHPDERDADLAAKLLGTSVEDKPETPVDVVRVIQRCRVVVTGSYHAAVFALAQGIPAVGLTRSPYYEAKFLGLQRQFEGLLGIVSLGEPDVGPRLSTAIDSAWEHADESRPQLLERAREQIEAGRAAYRHLFDLVSGRVAC